MLDLLGAGLTSLLQVPEVDAGTRSLNLHMNSISSMAGSQRFTHLEELILSSNDICEIQDLELLSCLRILDLSCNRIQRLSGLAGLVSLEQLLLAYNRVETLEGLQQLWGQEYHLSTLDLRKNRIAEPSQLLLLGGCTSLANLCMQESSSHAISRQGDENPVCSRAGYRAAVLDAVPWLLTLDGQAVPDAPRPDGRPPKEPPRAGGAQLTAGVEAAQQQEESRRVQAGAPEAAPPPTSEAALAELNEAVECLLEAQEASIHQSQSTRELQEEIQREVVGLRDDFQREEASHEALVARNRREARLRADLAEIASQIGVREEQHSAAEVELEESEASLSTVRRREEGLASEVKRGAEEEEVLQQEVKRESVQANELDAEERRALASLCRLEEDAMRSKAAADDLPALWRELRRMEEACASARRTGRLRAEEAAAKRRLLEDREAQISGLEATWNHVSARRRDCEAEAQRWAVEVAEEASALAALAARSGQEELLEQEQLDRANAALERELTALHRLRSEAAQCEEACAAVDLRNALAAARQQALESERRGREGLEAAAESLERLEQQLQAELQEAEAQALQRRSDLGVEEAQLQRWQLASRLADDQQSTGQLIAREVAAELHACRTSERRAMQQVETLTRRTQREQEAIEVLKTGTYRARRECQSVQYIIDNESVERSTYEACEEVCRSESSSIRALVREEEEVDASLEEHSATLESMTGELLERKERTAEVLSQVARMEENVTVKEHMVTHARRQITSLRESMREDTLQQGEKEEQHRRYMEDMEATTGECEEWIADLESSNEHSEREVDGLEASVGQRREALSFAESQLQQLLEAHAQREAQAQEQEQLIRNEGLAVLDEAQAAMAEMEERFRLERADQLQEQEHLRLELGGTLQCLERAPEQLRLLRERLQAERRAYQQRAAALLAGLGQ